MIKYQNHKFKYQPLSVYSQKLICTNKNKRNLSEWVEKLQTYVYAIASNTAVWLDNLHFIGNGTTLLRMKGLCGSMS